MLLVFLRGPKPHVRVLAQHKPTDVRKPGAAQPSYVHTPHPLPHAHVECKWLRLGTRHVRHPPTRTQTKTRDVTML